MFKLILLTIFLFVKTNAITELKYVTDFKLINPEETSKDRITKNGTPFDTKFAESKSVTNLRDSNGNYGDLIYKFRQNKDTLLVREVVIAEVLYSNDQDIRWTVSIKSGRITSVRVLNFGRERAYCLRIDVAAGDAEVVLRIPSLQDPRVLIEIYGY